MGAYGFGCWQFLDFRLPVESNLSGAIINLFDSQSGVRREREMKGKELSLARGKKIVVEYWCQMRGKSERRIVTNVCKCSHNNKNNNFHITLKCILFHFLDLISRNSLLELYECEREKVVNVVAFQGFRISTYQRPFVWRPK